MTVVYERLHGNLKALELHTVESIVDSYLESNSAQGKSVLEVMDHLVDQVARERPTTVAESRIWLARFPARKTPEDLDFAFQPSIDRSVIRELATLRFIHNAENVLAVGPPGTGKTYVALALGLEAAKGGGRECSPRRCSTR